MSKSYLFSPLSLSLSLSRITEDILIERAHRSREAIVARFLSCKQMTIESPEIKSIRNIQEHLHERRFLRNSAKNEERTDVTAAGDETEWTAIQATI